MALTKYTNPYAIEVIRSKKQDLVGGISNTDDLLDLLVSKGVLLPENQVLVSGITAQEEKNSRMLNILISRGERACRIFFYPCLKSVEPDLYHSIKAFVGSLNQNKDTRRQLIGYLLEKDGHGPIKNLHGTKKAPSKVSVKSEPKKSEMNACLEKSKDDTSKTKDTTSEILEAVSTGNLSLLKELIKDRNINDKISSSDTLLHLAAEHGQVSIINFLLRHGASPDLKDHHGRTALHRAAAKGNKGVSLTLVRAGADMYAKDEASKTAQHLASQNGHKNTVGALVEEEKRNIKHRTRFLHLAAVEDNSALADILLQTGAAVDAQDEQNKTALFHAVIQGNENVACVLLRAGAQLDFGTMEAAFKLNRPSLLSLLLKNMKKTMQENDVHSALFKAVERNLEGVVVALIESGVNVNVQNELGYTPLLLAAELGNVEVFKVLISNKAQLDARLPNQTSALHLAVQCGSMPITQLLLDMGMDPNTTGPKDQTPLHFSALYNQPALMGLLLHEGAHVNAVTHEGLTALHLVSRGGNAEAVAQLLERKANVHARDRHSKTALHWAAACDKVNVVKLLLFTGADVDVHEQERKTPLHLAAMAGNDEVITALIEQKAKFSAKDTDGCSALHYAAANGHCSAAATLLSAGRNKNVDERNAWRRTPLHLAAEHGHELLVRLLLERRAKINATDNNKDTPLHLACRAGRLGTVQKLVSWTQGQKANLQATNNVKKTAVQVAEAQSSQNHLSITTLLKKKMFLIK